MYIHGHSVLLNCFMCVYQGHIPSPRAAHAVDLIDSIVYMFGGRSQGNRLNDLYTLDLRTLVWTRIRYLEQIFEIVFYSTALRFKHIYIASIA